MNAYGGQHQAVRRATLPFAYGGPCARCGRPMLPGQALDLDHHDDRPGYRGFAHAKCNRAAGARKGNALRAARRERTRRMLTECALGVEISEDRRHCSIAAAGTIADGFALVELTEYLDGSAGAVDAVLRLQVERTVPVVVVDGRSHAATLLRPLADAGVEVTQPSTSDVAVATGDFLDELAAGRLRHVGDPRLDAAVRHGTSRPLSGAVAWERRGQAVDVSPLTAATLALWGWATRPSPPVFFAAWR